MLARLAPRAAQASKRAASASLRFNSSSSSTTASRVIQLAARAQKPNAAEVAVPVVYAAGAALTIVAWNRVAARDDGDNVQTLLVV